MANNLLKGKRGVIFGALDQQSIAWKVAERCVEEGAQITLTNATGCNALRSNPGIRRKNKCRNYSG